eukprot:7142523-Prymnesium_polylepis.1
MIMGFRARVKPVGGSNFHVHPRVKHRTTLHGTRIRHLSGRVGRERPNPLKKLKSAGCSLLIASVLNYSGL